MAPSLPWCIRRSRSSRCLSNVGPGVRLVSLGLVLRPLASPGPDREFLALWAVFWGADSEFEVRFSKLGRLASFNNVCKKAEFEFRIVSVFFVDQFHNRWLPNQIASDFHVICGQWKLRSRSFWRCNFHLNPAGSDRVDSNFGIAWQNQWSDPKVFFFGGGHPDPRSIDQKFAWCLSTKQVDLKWPAIRIRFENSYWLKTVDQFDTSYLSVIETA